MYHIIMETFYGVLINVILFIILYIANGPYCPKHKLTKMKKTEERCLDSSFTQTNSVVKHIQTTYKCPKCGEMLVIEREIPV